MSNVFSKDTQNFLWDLKFNNERPWFNEHKEQFERVLNTPFKELGRNTFEQFKKRFPEESYSLHISRIYRDARRLFGRGPYKDHLWFSIKNSSGERNDASFFFEIGPEGWCYGMGVYCPKSEEMEMFRKSIDANPARFERLALDIEKMPEFIVEGEEYKRPKGNYDGVIGKWYNRKYVAAVSYRDFGGELFREDLCLLLADAFEKLNPMYEYLSRFGKDLT